MPPCAARVNANRRIVARGAHHRLHRVCAHATRVCRQCRMRAQRALEKSRRHPFSGNRRRARDTHDTLAKRNRNQRTPRGNSTIDHVTLHELRDFPRSSRDFLLNGDARISAPSVGATKSPAMRSKKKTPASSTQTRPSRGDTTMIKTALTAAIVLATASAAFATEFDGEPRQPLCGASPARRRRSRCSRPATSRCSQPGLVRRKTDRPRRREPRRPVSLVCGGPFGGGSLRRETSLPGTGPSTGSPRTAGSPAPAVPFCSDDFTRHDGLTLRSACDAGHVTNRHRSDDG